MPVRVRGWEAARLRWASGWIDWLCRMRHVRTEPPGNGPENPPIRAASQEKEGGSGLAGESALAASRLRTPGETPVCGARREFR